MKKEILSPKELETKKPEELIKDLEATDGFAMVKKRADKNSIVYGTDIPAEIRDLKEVGIEKDPKI